jgi:SAM-dependent MidA family methyltransferase
VNRLGERIAKLIEAQGPLSIAQFMTIALHDPQEGYYATRDPIGAGGDFITAPEISQVFGEILGLWIVQAWRDQGRPSPARLVELGPGRGTLMGDVLHAGRLDPRFLESADVILIEASARLRAAQARAFGAFGGLHIEWREHFDDSLTDRPLFLIANEFFDALPIRQFVRTERGWCERMITIGAQLELQFALFPRPSVLDIPHERGAAELGAVYEVSPAAEALVEQIASTIRANGGGALIVDYGYGADAEYGDTLQAVSQHEFANVLERPGAADLSTHVDFGALARAAERAKTSALGPVGQGEFLCKLGVLERAAQLSQGNLKALQDDLERLIAPKKMGTLFKVLGIVPKNAAKPAGF